MKSITTFLFVFLCAAGLVAQEAQTVHRVPQGSRGNNLDLTVASDLPAPVKGMTVTLAGVPSWMHVTPAVFTLPELASGKEQNVHFTFAVDKDATLREQKQIQLVVGSEQTGSWSKEITVEVTLPDRFELHQNYPNPFNPTTTIDYTLPKSSHVKLTIYNVLGQEINTLVDGVEEAGYKSVAFDASTLPSGVYFYRLQAGGITMTRKMMILK